MQNVLLTFICMCSWKYIKVIQIPWRRCLTEEVPVVAHPLIFNVASGSVITLVSLVAGLDLCVAKPTLIKHCDIKLN